MAYLAYINSKIVVSTTEQEFSILFYKYSMRICYFLVIVAALAVLASSFHGWNIFVL